MLKLNYSAKLLIFSVLIFVTAIFLAKKFSIALSYVILLSIFFTGFSFILNMRLQNALKSENKNQFTFAFLGLTGLKMFSCLIILLFGLYFATTSKLELGICIMSYYMLYTTFEVWHWIGRLKQG